MKSFYIFLSIILILGCQGDKNKYNFSSPEIKDFYTNCHGMDYIRFPLIMPYDAICIDFENKNWAIGTESIHSMTETKQIAVIDSTILVKRDYAKEWFVIIPSKKIEMGFETESEFKSYIGKFGIKDVKWIEVNRAYHQFEDTECLPWIIGCSE